MKRLLLAGGVICVLLGGLWLVQGLGLLRIEPVLCLTECEPVQGPSLVWSIAGLVGLALGGFLIRLFVRRRHGIARIQR